MESDNSGLDLVQDIRDKLNNHRIRLILRTGQPGYAPESDTIRLYDINDYKTKSELTRVRLLTSIAIAIRSYSQIKQLEANRNGLEEVLAATSELGRFSDLKAFASGIASHLCALLKVDRDCLICADLKPLGNAAYILAAEGYYSHWIGMPLAAVPETQVRQQLTSVLNNKQHALHDGLCLYFPGTDNQALAAFIKWPRAITASDRRLLEVFCSNISVAFENLQLYRSIEQLAYQDPLVGLPNRNGFLAEIEHQISQPAQTAKAVALVDLDNFSYMNSVLDDAFGDEILQAVAQRLTSQLSDNCFVARVSGDVFGVLSHVDDLTPERIEAVFAEPFALHRNEPLRISATSGLIILDQKPLGATDILKNVGVALKQAKHFHRGKTVFFAPELADAARDRMQLLSRLRTAFSDEHLKLHFQPFIRLHDGVTTGAECLLRWQTSDGQFIPPDQFIPLAEQSGMMVALGHWITRTALRWRSGLVGRVDDAFRVAINVSLVQLKEDDFVESMMRNIQEQGLQGHHVELELTESVAADDVIDVSQKLKQLGKHGVSIALDDFGTGYSSLSILSNLPIDRLKIDRSFVSGNAADQPRFSMAQTIMELAGNFQMRTIAEGIETEEQRVALQEAGCQEGQGYFFSRPLDEQRFDEWLGP
nr:EAL domain-containing protein [Halomonas llamarensis]